MHRCASFLTWAGLLPAAAAPGGLLLSCWGQPAAGETRAVASGPASDGEVVKDKCGRGEWREGYGTLKGCLCTPVELPSHGIAWQSNTAATRICRNLRLSRVSMHATALESSPAHLCCSLRQGAMYTRHTASTAKPETPELMIAAAHLRCSLHQRAGLASSRRAPNDERQPA
jgi:hypothetical protein